MHSLSVTPIRTVIPQSGFFCIRSRQMTGEQVHGILMEALLFSEVSL